MIDKSTGGLANVRVLTGVIWACTVFFLPMIVSEWCCSIAFLGRAALRAFRPMLELDRRRAIRASRTSAYVALATGCLLVVSAVVTHAGVLVPIGLLVLFSGIQRGCPPVLLLLAASGRASERLHCRIVTALHPAHTAALLNQPSDIPIQTSLYAATFRTADAEWQPAVAQLEDIVRFIVIDGRIASSHLESELHRLLTSKNLTKVLFVSSADNKSPLLDSCCEGRVEQQRLREVMMANEEKVLECLEVFSRRSLNSKLLGMIGLKAMQIHIAFMRILARCGLEKAALKFIEWRLRTHNRKSQQTDPPGKIRQRRT
jgi:hypothetical protein